MTAILKLIVFFTEFFLTNIVFSLVIWSFLLRLNRHQKHCSIELLLYSLGLGPAFTTLLLYYFLRLFPKQSNIFYITAILVIYIILFFLSYKVFFLQVKVFYKKTMQYFCNKFSILKKQKLISVENDTIAIHCQTSTQNLFKTLENLAFFATSMVLGVIALAIILLFFFNCFITPISGTVDVFQYLSIGKALFNTKYYEPVNILLDPEIGILRLIHAPGYSLLLTWEFILESPFGLQRDYYFRLIPAYYGLLILLIQMYWLSKKSRWLAIIGPFLVLSSLGFYYSLLNYEIDMYRIFFTLVSWIFLAHALDKQDFLSCILFGIFCGCAAFVHSLDFIISWFSIGTFFLFFQGSFINRVKVTFLIVAVACISGSLHYILDIFFGTGWYLTTIIEVISNFSF